MTIRVVPLGAGQDVGRSCILLSLGGKNIMLDCGMHMGYQDARRFPDFDYISRTGQFTDIIDCVIISHFHLDHCGALPYFTEVCGYDGPIYATYPTKAIMPVLLEDMRKVMTGHRAGPAPFTSADIAACMDKVIPIDLMQTHPVDDELAIRVYYAGHVLGAGMFHLQVGHESVVYTGDYNMTPDRHLGAAWIDQCRPDLLITESTYATMIRSSKRARERDFLQKIHECVAQGGKVLVPVFALGRAQELCILVEDYWARMDMDCPVFFSAGLTERANAYYKLFIGWTNEKIKTSFVDHNVFDFRYIKPWDASLVSHAGPMLLFATPGMLHGGISLEVFAQWCGDPKNMIILPGYCAVGTAGAKVLSGAREIQIDPRQTVTVNMAVANLSFSAHADAKGILQLITMCRPRHVMLVHGERTKMPVLKERIERELGIPCHTPANGTAVHLDTAPRVPVRIDRGVLRAARHAAAAGVAADLAAAAADAARPLPYDRLRPPPPAQPFTGTLHARGLVHGDADGLRLLPSATPAARAADGVRPPEAAQPLVLFPDPIAAVARAPKGHVPAAPGGAAASARTDPQARVAFHLRVRVPPWVSAAPAAAPATPAAEDARVARERTALQLVQRALPSYLPPQTRVRATPPRDAADAGRLHVDDHIVLAPWSSAPSTGDGDRAEPMLRLTWTMRYQTLVQKVISCLEATLATPREPSPP